MERARSASSVELLFRRHAAELTAQLVRRLGIARLELAEDAVQSALVSALRVWPVRGFPDQPRAWLARVAYRSALDQLRRREDGALPLELGLPGASPSGIESRLQGEVDDDVLRLIFACCHPVLSEELQLTLTLKVALGFSIQELSPLLSTTPAAVAQRIVRSKRLLRESYVTLEIPAGAALNERLDGVLSVLYLLFDAGFAPATGALALRTELCLEALRLIEQLAQHPATRRSDVHALAALMFFLAARLPTRTDAHGALVHLEAQDRRCWDVARRGRGFWHLTRAMGTELTRYHLEAGIAAEHALARSLEETDWDRVVSIYDALPIRVPTPAVRLNRAIALGEAGRMEDAEAELARLAATTTTADERGALAAVRAHFLERRGQHRAAALGFQAASTDALTAPRRDLLLLRAEQCWVLARKHEPPGP